MDKRDYINLASLASIQLANAALPIVVFPFVLKVVGADKFSKIVVTESVSMIVLAIVIYSFEVNGVSKIIGLDLKKDLGVISAKFYEVLCTRLAIFAVIVVILLLASFFMESVFTKLLFTWLAVPLSYIFQSSWFYQGLEKNGPLAIITVLSRLLCVGTILLAINDTTDYYLVPVIIGSCYMLGGLASFSYAVLTYKIKIFIPSRSEIFTSLFNGKEIFIGNTSVVLYSGINVLILSFFTKNDIAISTYSMSEKLIKCLQAAARPLNQLFYPKVIHLIKDIYKPDIQTYKRILKLVVPQLAVITSLIVIITASYLCFGDYFYFISKYPHKETIIVLVAVMSVSTIFGISNYMFGVAGLNHLGEKYYLAKSILTVGVSNVIYCSLLVMMFGAFGAAAAFVLSEVLLCVLISYRYARKI